MPKLKTVKDQLSWAEKELTVTKILEAAENFKEAFGGSNAYVAYVNDSMADKLLFGLYLHGVETMAGSFFGKGYKGIGWRDLRNTYYLTCGHKNDLRIIWRKKEYSIPFE